MADRVYGKFQWAGVKVDTAAKSQVNNEGTDAYAVLTSAAAPDPSASPATAVTATVASSATPVTLLAASDVRRGATISNDSTAILYILMGAGTVSATNYTYAVAAKSGVAQTVTIPFGFTGVITGLWAAANGSALITNFSA